MTNKKADSTTKAKTDKRTVVKLKLIRVETENAVDTVYLNHNQMRVFSLRCGVQGSSQIRISTRFYAFDQEMWDDVLNEYLGWKRKQLPAFRLPNYSGRTKDGHRHPFRTFPRPGRPRHDTEHEEPELEEPPRPEMED